MSVSRLSRNTTNHLRTLSIAFNKNKSNNKQTNKQTNNRDEKKCAETKAAILDHCKDMPSPPTIDVSPTLGTPHFTLQSLMMTDTIP
jgi:hypothetical protein